MEGYLRRPLSFSPGPCLLHEGSSVLLPRVGWSSTPQPLSCPALPQQKPPWPPSLSASCLHSLGGQDLAILYGLRSWPPGHFC